MIYKNYIKKDFQAKAERKKYIKSLIRAFIANNINTCFKKLNISLKDKL